MWYPPNYRVIQNPGLCFVSLSYFVYTKIICKFFEESVLNLKLTWSDLIWFTKIFEYFDIFFFVITIEFIVLYSKILIEIWNEVYKNMKPWITRVFSSDQN